MKKLVSVLFVLVLFCASANCFASSGNVSLGDKVKGCIKNPISCTKATLVKTGKAVYGVAEKTGKAMWGLTVGNVQKLVNK